MLLVDEGPLVPILELAIFLAGAVIVPLDPKEAAERLGMMLDDIIPNVFVVKEGAGGGEAMENVWNWVKSTGN